MPNKTYSQSQADVSRQWYELDASGVPVGRLSTQIARLLSGKDKPTYTPHIDGGDYVVVVNASGLKMTGSKPSENKYRHSGYPGGIKSITKGKLLATNPERLLELAVKGMLPKNKLINERMKRLKVYPEAEHEHSAQQPKKLEVKHGR
jgi:large subunit ribosomal protein L13